VILIFRLTRQLVIFKSVWHCLVLYDLINVLSFSLFIVLKKEKGLIQKSERLKQSLNLGVSAARFCDLWKIVETLEKRYQPHSICPCICIVVNWWLFSFAVTIWDRGCVVCGLYFLLGWDFRFCLSYLFTMSYSVSYASHLLIHDVCCCIMICGPLKLPWLLSFISKKWIHDLG
jgi:hypothetical protein